jgi:hypothetical protein
VRHIPNLVRVLGRRRDRHLRRFRTIRVCCGLQTLQRSRTLRYIHRRPVMEDRTDPLFHRVQRHHLDPAKELLQDAFRFRLLLLLLLLRLLANRRPHLLAAQGPIRPQIGKDREPVQILDPGPYPDQTHRHVRNHHQRHRLEEGRRMHPNSSRNPKTTTGERRTARTAVVTLVVTMVETAAETAAEGTINATVAEVTSLVETKVTIGATSTRLVMVIIVTMNATT